MKDIHGYCNNPLCITYLLTSTYPEGFCEICDRLITRTNGLTMTEANATAEAIMLITNQMTPEYAQYLHPMQWDGKYPSTMLGSLDDLGVIIDTTP